MQLSKAQAALLHTFESAASSAILTLIVGLVQYLSTHQFNWQELLTVFSAGFVAAFGLIYKSVLTDPALPQAESDTAVAAQSLAQKAINHIEYMWPILHQLNSAQKAATPAPLSVGTATTPPPTLLVQPSSVPQMAFPTLNTGTQSMATYSVAATLPPRSWTDTALTQAITPQPPRG